MVERTFASMRRSRRLTRHYEQTTSAHETMITISQVALSLRRLEGQTELRDSR